MFLLIVKDSFLYFLFLGDISIEVSLFFVFLNAKKREPFTFSQ
ncbi:hypothetical protein MUS1_04545 [Marinomonas ushuaiensis DSM 15871]|uniref:Uncharacterized protein n=1 Tax=Marinomonas ushuaiensis DSM 15871 TaxID=1122207 RepID=X7E2L6_9GAMM|nr:hypothetical protein MUS1_04545 [Marinomonas ushuaiensis DSM 15871]